eukprot:4467396-Alexandrium_andersonii.AAC.1
MPTSACVGGCRRTAARHSSWRASAWQQSAAWRSRGGSCKSISVGRCDAADRCASLNPWSTRGQSSRG